MEAWARKSGAIFEPSKTGLIHFTRRSDNRGHEGPELQLQGQNITSSKHLKLLGVSLDSRMKFHQHVATVRAKATRQCLAIRRLRGVRPKQVKQLYNATAGPIMDYCASAWYGPEKWGTISLLRNVERVQRIGAQATALEVAQAEAGLEDTSTRLQRKVANHLVRSLTIPEEQTHCSTVSRGYTRRARVTHLHSPSRLKSLALPSGLQ